MEKKKNLICFLFICLTFPLHAQITAKEEFEQAMEILGREDPSDEDIDKAMESLFNSANEGYAKAQYTLGVFLILTEGEEDNKEEYEKEGMEYIMKAAKQEDVYAMHFLGLCYQEGRYVQKDEDMANFWLGKAKEAGYEENDNSEANFDKEDIRELYDDYRKEEIPVITAPQEPEYFYTAETNQPVNFRKGPSKSSALIKLLKKGEYLFVFKSDLTNGYYRVINIETDEEGYVHQKYIKFLDKVQVDESGSFKVVQKINSPYAEVTIYNEADVTANIHIGKLSFKVPPHKNKLLKIDGGTYYISVSSPNVRGYVNKETFKGGYEYERSYYIKRY